MHYDGTCDCLCGLTYEDYLAYTVNLHIGLSGFHFYVTVTQPMAEAFKRAHISMENTRFKLVEMSGVSHTLDLNCVEFIITL